MLLVAADFQIAGAIRDYKRIRSRSSIDQMTHRPSAILRL